MYTKIPAKGRMYGRSNKDKKAELFKLVFGRAGF